MTGPKTEMFQMRLLSINGGYSYRSPVTLTPAELDKYWNELLAKMDPALKAQVQAQMPPEGDRRELLARYLQLSPSHLVVG
jgi:hypothetical protein